MCSFRYLNHKDAASLTVLGLHALQHRGQDSTGIVTFDNKNFLCSQRNGASFRGFFSIRYNKKTEGRIFLLVIIGYGTTGESALKNVQPLFSELNFGGVAIAHNGNLTNTQKLKKQLIDSGAIFQSTSDTEVVLHLLSNGKG